MINYYLFFGLISLYLIGAFTSILTHKNNRICSKLSFLTSSLASLFGIAFSFSVLFGESFSYAPTNFSYLNYGVYIDKLSAFFILIISIVTFAVSIYSIGYVKEYFGKKNIGLLGFLYNLFILSMLMVVSANNAIMFLIVWELMAIISYFLVVYEHEKPEVTKAGFTYIVMTHIGTGFIILSFLIFYTSSGSFNFETFKTASENLSPLLKNLAFLFALIGFGTKAGIVPLHIWLPSAHPAAPSNISALMSGIMIKTAIYMLIRVFFDYLGADVLWWGILLLIIASISTLIGVMYALVEQDIKRLLAFSSIENIGIILIGISISMIFIASNHPELAGVGLIAALYHTINHAVFKSLLFMSAGSIVYSTHTKNIEEYGGLIKKMPYTAFFFLIGSISISALPPFNGFVSEWLTFQSQLLSINLTDSILKIGVLFSGVILALSSALVAACFVKAFGISFLAMPRSHHSENAKEVPYPMLAGMSLLSLACILLGILSFYFIPILDTISSSLTGTSSKIVSGFSVTSFSYASISPLFMLILMIIFIPIPLILYHYTRSQKYETWGCGQPISTSRNEYSATAFTKPIRMWLGSIYRPHREIQTTYSVSRFFKESYKFGSEIEPIFECYIYEPIVKAIKKISRIIKLIQTGSIHAYLAYIFTTLVILLLFVMSGGKL